MAAVESGSLDVSVVDAAVRRVLRLASLADPARGPVMDLGVAPGDRLSPAQLALLKADQHHAPARSAAEGCVTLLRNENNVLPLSSASRRVAVIGAFAAHDAEFIEPRRAAALVEPLRRAAAAELLAAGPAWTRDFSYWDTPAGTRRLEGCEFTIEVGASSRDIRLRATITLPHDPHPAAPDPGREAARARRVPLRRGPPRLRLRRLTLRRRSRPTDQAVGGTGW